MKRSVLDSSLLVRKGSATPSGASPTETAPQVVRVPPTTSHAMGAAKGVFGTRPQLAASGGEAVLPKEVAPATSQPGARRKAAQAPRAKRGPGKTERTRLSLRLDRQQHLRLKLAAVHSGRNMRDLIIAAIDDYLTNMGPAVLGGRCACLMEAPVASTRAGPPSATNDGVGRKHGTRAS